MSFTDRFIVLPIKIFDTRKADVLGHTEYVDNYMKILPMEIASYKPMTDEDNDDVECISLTMKNGDNFYVYLTIDEFEKLLNNHHLR